MKRKQLIVATSIGTVLVIASVIAVVIFSSTLTTSASSNMLVPFV